MDLGSQAAQIHLPMRFHCCDTVSVNYRHYLLYLREDLVGDLEDKITEIRFLWTENAEIQNRKNRLAYFPQQTLNMLELMEGHLAHVPCKVVTCETGKQYCSIAVATPVPQLVYRVLQEMPCPNKFSAPQVINHPHNAKAYIEEKLKTTDAPNG